jgi:methylenetetrahydrofolate dehydrogenase (NADP+) / methenyltetrahydrofolate cyclohydrolase
MIIDGRALAREVLARTRARVSLTGLKVPKILAIVANETPATKSYLAIKSKRATDAGCILEVKHIKHSLRPCDIVDMSKDADAIIVQLPLSAGIDAQAACDAIPVEKDADVLSSDARAKFERGDADALLPPVVGAIRTILESGNVKIAGKKAMVIGEGWLVGKPAATWLRQQGADVSVFTSKSGDLLDGTLPAGRQVRAADIIVSGVGSPHLIKPDMLKQGVVLIDAGTSESGGEVVGDADSSCAAKCSLFTPVPGGVGPLAVAHLFDNAVTLAEHKI